MEIKKRIQEKAQQVPGHIWILGGIVLVGIFLRTYGFHQWLEFKGDQARDAMLVHKVLVKEALWPQEGPFMGGTGVGITETNSFHMGPFYYQTQILAAKIFGDYPDRLAYFDLFLSVLAIPLFYFFLVKYFKRNLALALTGLYATSYFAISYARFAWNPNSIPFFTLLLLLSLFEFGTRKTQVAWKWVIALGLTLGISFQLHAIPMILFSVVSLLVFVFVMIKEKSSWKKWAVVFALFAICNAVQITHEIRTDFTNVKLLWNNVAGKNEETAANKNLLSRLRDNASCHAEANFYMLAPLVQNNCTYYLSGDSARHLARKKTSFFNVESTKFKLQSWGMTLLSLLGFALFIFNLKNEKESAKRNFLALLAIYLGVALVVMFPVIKGKLELRYFNYAFFLPFVFLGFLADFVEKKFSQKTYRSVVVILLGFVFFANAIALIERVKNIEHNGIAKTHLVVLGDVEALAEFIKTHSGGKREVNIGGDYEIMAYAYRPLEYLLARDGIVLSRFTGRKPNENTNAAAFYVSGEEPEDAEYAKVSEVYIAKIK